MVQITLPDGCVKQYPAPVTGLKIAQDIGATLAKNAVAIHVNNDLWDLGRPIEQDAKIALVTRDSEEGLELLRHDVAHVMAEAVKELYPETQVTIGPAIENGFYYDFHREESFTPEDLEKIEARMQEIVDRDEAIEREVWNRQEAVEFFKKKGEIFKADIIASIPSDEPITLYRQGDFIDLCRGPHLPSTKQLGKGFKLMKLAGAYWRGDSNNPMLQRIYGTAWATEKQLKEYLHMLEEAQKRDHRKFGREMKLFHMQEEATGSVFWHPRGWTLFKTIQEYMTVQQDKYGYQEVRTPVLVDRKLWERSGHWEKFRENMFTTESDPEHIYALKPMNCPCHVEIFRQGMKSYRDLPLRLSEFGHVHRNEPSGSLHGLMRLRAFVQDDAHIFCTPEQISEETRKVCEMIQVIYKDFGFEDIQIKFADRPPVRAGSDEIWDRAEAALMKAVNDARLDYTMNPGEGAFYGPKLEFQLRDAIGRTWQCGTHQVDFVLPERLNAEYVGPDGEKHRPAMLHRALFGSFERFIGNLIEHHAGHFPLWLAPLQVVVATITDTAHAYAQEVHDVLVKAQLRCEIDTRNEKISYKIRDWSTQKIPVILVVGQKEAENQSVAMRRLGGDKQSVLPLQEVVEKLAFEAKMPQ